MSLIYHSVYLNNIILLYVYHNITSQYTLRPLSFVLLLLYILLYYKSHSIFFLLFLFEESIIF